MQANLLSRDNADNAKCTQRKRRGALSNDEMPSGNRTVKKHCIRTLMIDVNTNGFQRNRYTTIALVFVPPHPGIWPGPCLNFSTGANDNGGQLARGACYILESWQFQLLLGIGEKEERESKKAEFSLL